MMNTVLFWTATIGGLGVGVALIRFGLNNRWREARAERERADDNRWRDRLERVAAARAERERADDERLRRDEKLFKIGDEVFVKPIDDAVARRLGYSKLLRGRITQYDPDERPPFVILVGSDHRTAWASDLRKFNPQPGGG